MKKMKILATFLVAILLITAMPTSIVQAETTTSASLIVSNDPASSGLSIKDKTYNLYEIFSATTVVSSDDGEDDNIEYTLNTVYYGFFNEILSSSYDETDDGTFTHEATAYIDGLETTEELQAFVTSLRDYIVDEENSITFDYSTSKYYISSDVEYVTAEGVELGYYLVLDTDALSDTGTTVTVTNGSLANIPGRAGDGSVTADVTISLKGSQPTLEKEIYHNDLDDWDDVADYSIGDTVEFLITATIPSDVSAYTDYTYTITDNLSEGLTYDSGSLKVYTSSTLDENSEVKTYYSLHTNSSDYTFRLDFEMMNIKKDFPSGEVMYIYYTATVTEDAAIYGDGYEQNTAKLEYSNNPYDSTSTGTVDDTVYGYTFALDVIKTAGDGTTPLSGAKFALYEVTTSDAGEKRTQIYLASNGADGDVDVYYVSNGDTSSGGGVIITSSYGTFTIEGLDDAKNYVLVETEAPERYNAAAEISFTISATYEKDSSSGVMIPTVSATNVGDGLSITVINTSASLLPSTGGIGTTIVMMGGGSLMLLACVLLVFKKKRA